MTGPDRPNPLIYGDFERLVTITVRGERFAVPEGVPLIRALQYMQFEMGRLTCDWSLFCFNDTIGCCVCKVRKPGVDETEGARACCLRVEEGLEVVRLPRSARVMPSALGLAEDALAEKRSDPVADPSAISISISGFGALGRSRRRRDPEGDDL